MTGGRRSLIAAVLIAIAAIAGCGGPGEVGPQTYGYAKAIYSLANRQATDRIDAVAEQIAADVASGAVSDREAAHLNAALDDCRAGDWKEAMAAARQMLQDQVGR